MNLKILISIIFLTLFFGCATVPTRCGNGSIAYNNPYYFGSPYPESEFEMKYDVFRW